MLWFSVFAVAAILAISGLVALMCWCCQLPKPSQGSSSGDEDPESRFPTERDVQHRRELIFCQIHFGEPLTRD